MSGHKVSSLTTTCRNKFTNRAPKVQFILAWAGSSGDGTSHRNSSFNINYLGADQASITLNFSKGRPQVIRQYYQLIRLGRPGFQFHHEQPHPHR